MVYLFTDKYDKLILERRSQKNPTVDRALGLMESHFGVSLIAETRLEIMLSKWDEKTKEESSTSPEAEEMLGETAGKLHDYSAMQPKMPSTHLEPVYEREPVFPGR